MAKKSSHFRIKADIIGKNCQTLTANYLKSFVDTDVYENDLLPDHPIKHPKKLVALSMDKVENGEIYDELENALTAIGCGSDDINTRIDGVACRLFLSERQFNKPIVEKLLEHIPGNSKTGRMLRKLLPDLISKQPEVKKHAMQTLRQIVQEAKEFQGKEGDRLLFQCTQSIIDENWGIEHSYYSPKLKSWVSPDEAYDEAARKAIRMLDADKELLCSYNSKLVMFHGKLSGHFDDCDCCEMGRIGHPVEATDIALAICLDKIALLKSSEYIVHSPEEIEASSNEEARKLLYHQREAIADKQARRIVDFILGREDMRIAYVNGNSVIVPGTGRRAGGYARSMLVDGMRHIELCTGLTPGGLVHECAHIAISLTYHNDYAEPFADYDDRKLFIQALRRDTEALGGVAKSGLRSDFRIPKRLYEYHNFGQEIPVDIIHARADGKWTDKLAQKYPHLTAYVDKIVLPDIELRIQGREGFVPRPASLEELVSPDWPPPPSKISQTSRILNSRLSEDNKKR